MKKVLGLVSLTYKLYVGLAFLVTLVVFYPPIAFLLRKSENKQKTMPWFSFWSRTFRLMIGLPKKVVSRSPSFPDSPFIICANHASYLDIALMPSLLRGQDFLFMGKHEILEYPLLKTFFKRLHIPVNRTNRLQSARAFLSASNALKNGWSIVIFPEGGIPDGQRPKMISFKTGAFKLAMENQVPIVPVTFINNYRLFSDPGDWLGPARPGLAKVIIHSTILPEDYVHLTPETLSAHVYGIIDEPLRELY
jgi:1-acyl-sn-glycerol-3-phosphate acyltransferase